MIPFYYQDDRLFCEKVDLQEIAEKHGTPAYVYSRAGLVHNYQAFDRAFADHPHRVCYALKANANMEILKLMVRAGAGADVVSGGELALALEAGFPADRIVFASVGKTDAEIRLALKSRILALNVESREELEVTAKLAAEMGGVAPIAVRINPDIDIEGHPYLTTGKSANKFGISLEEARECYLWGAGQTSLRMVGVHCHVGSMIKKVDPYQRSAETLMNFVEDLRARGIRLEHIDLGGGLGVDYTRVLGETQSPWFMEPSEIAGAVIPILKKTGCEILFEPGRSIVGPNGVLLSRVLFNKETKGKKFLIVDAAMNDLIRPSLYGAHHEILPLSPRAGDTKTMDVVGAICESGDFLAKDRSLPPMQRGDYLAAMTAGAYGYTLASNYNERPRAVEVLVDGKEFTVIRERERSRF
jgi:diaminopimelate decarboxylase